MTALAPLAGGLGLLTTLTPLVATGPAFGLSLAGVWMIGSQLNAPVDGA